MTAATFHVACNRHWSLFSIAVFVLGRIALVAQRPMGGAENAGVENAGGITYGKPSEQKTLKIPGVQAKTIRSQTVS